MYFLLLRLLPWLSGIGMTIALWFQWRDPLLYPIPLLMGLALFLASAVLLLWRRVSLPGFFERVVPPFMLVSAMGFALLMVDHPGQQLFLSAVAVIMVTISLEMMFYFLFDPKRYPVNALSHLALASVPITAYGLAVGFAGLTVFIQLAGWIPCLVFGLYGLGAYWMTEHPVADAASRRRWRILGAVIGLQVALFSILLPLEVWTQGLLAALLFSAPLRIRRYAFPPAPSSRVAWGEAVATVLFFLTLLLTARWA
ncbi:hypothetical protein KBD34_00690 [Patescibacteria group bacterium]|nr:hypothetical protein [Patescibacteria group bacterium]